MKIRNGFVSNSSSSSFIIKVSGEFPDVLSVAENMIFNKIDSYREYDDVEEDLYFNLQIENIKNNIQNLKSLNKEDSPIYFKSTNYNTFIRKITDDDIFVDTCNNIQWDIQDNAYYYVPKELSDKYEDLYDISNEKVEDKFYLLEVGIFAQKKYSKEYSYDHCNKCYDELWILNEEVMCMSCDREKITRSLKLNKIKNNI